MQVIPHFTFTAACPCERAASLRFGRSYHDLVVRSPRSFRGHSWSRWRFRAGWVSKGACLFWGNVLFVRVTFVQEMKGDRLCGSTS